MTDKRALDDDYLWDGSGEPDPEIAERTGLTAGSVRVNLHRGMKLLREKLNR